MQKIATEKFSNKFKTNSIKFKEKVLVFCTIIVCDDTLLFGTSNISFLTSLKLPFYLVLLLFSLRKEILLNKNFSIYFLILSILLSLIATSSLLLGNFYLLFVFLTGYIFLFNFGVLRYFKYFSDVMIMLAKASLVVYFANILFPSIINLFPTITNYADVQFNFLFISNTFKGINMFRNTGIFREPGVYGIYLCVAIIYILFIKKEIFDFNSRKNLVILIFTVITTLSTASFFILGFILLLFILSNRQFLKLFYLCTACSLLYFLSMQFPEISYILFGKLDNENYEYLSTLARLSSVKIPYDIFIDNIFFGVGLDNFTLIYPKYSLRLYGIEFSTESSATNTFINFFAVYGIFAGVLIVKLFYKTSQAIGGKYSLLFLFLFIIMFSSQEMKFSFLFALLLSYGQILKISDEQ